MTIDKSKPVIRWIILADEGVPARIVEVEDIMRCIEGPGDYGWVEQLNGGGHRSIAEYEQIFETPGAAKEKWIATLKDRLAQTQQQLAEAEAIVV